MNARAPDAVIETAAGRMINLPAKMVDPLFSPYRYKVFHGGRGGGKSHSVAKALLVLGASQRLRILCAREVQKSIKDSVKKLLDDQIELLGLSSAYQSLDTEIRGRNGTEFIFSGLSGQTADSLKSYEGVDIAWCEEAHTISDQSWTILTPTIRKPDSEIWVTFNPSMDSDPVWQRFVVNRAPSSVVVEINWRDNPWFPEVLELERQHCKVAFPDDYDNIWEGKCRSSVIGAIYAAEMQDAVKAQRICAVPYNPKLKVHAIWDLGWNDSTSIILAQKVGPSQIAIIDYIEDSCRTLDHYATLLRQRGYQYAYDWLPHDASTKNLQTGISTHQVLKRLGRRTRAVPQIGVEPGIKQARMALPRCFFDAKKAARLVECLKRYRRGVPTSTGEPGSPVHDEYSHGADAFRYLSVVADRLSNDDDASTDTARFEAFEPECGY